MSTATKQSPLAGRPDSARPTPPTSAGEHPFADVTLNFGRRLALQRLSRGEALADLDTDEVMLPLVQAGLVGVWSCGYVITTEGVAYLATTRRLPRPGPPALPPGWTEPVKGCLWRYETPTITGLALPEGDVKVSPRSYVWRPIGERLAVRIEVSRLTLEMLTYLRARWAYYSRTATVTSAGPSPRAEAGTGDGIEGAPAQLGESSHVDRGA